MAYRAHHTRVQASTFSGESDNQLSLHPHEMTLERTGSSAQTNFEATHTLRQTLPNSQPQSIGVVYGSASHSKSGSGDVKSQCTYGNPYQTVTDTLSPRSTQANTGRFNNPEQSQIPPLPTSLAQARPDPSGTHDQLDPPHSSAPHATSYGNAP